MTEFDPRWCSNAAGDLPGNSTACGVANYYSGNDSATLQLCCKASHAVVANYSFQNFQSDDIWYPGLVMQGCYQYCNISDKFFNKSDVYKCLNANRASYGCRDGFKKSDGTRKRPSPLVLLGIAIVAGGWVFRMDMVGGPDEQLWLL